MTVSTWLTMTLAFVAAGYAALRGWERFQSWREAKKFPEKR